MTEKITSTDILSIVARKAGLRRKFLDSPRRKVLMISNGDRFFVSSPSNSAQAGIYPNGRRHSFGLFRDKAWTKQMLKKHGFRVTEGRHFYTVKDWGPRNGRHALSQAVVYAQKLGFPVFVKPNTGSQGKYGSIVYNKTQLGRHVKEMTEYCKIFMIERLIQLPEYRVFVLNGVPQFAYRKERSAIVGDGVSTIVDLLDRFHLIPSLFFANQLRAKKIKLHTVLKHGESIDVLPVANITQGAKICDYTTEFNDEFTNWVSHLANTLDNPILGVDFFSSSGLDNPKKFQIIEINHQPSLIGIWEAGYRSKVHAIWNQIFMDFF